MLDDETVIETLCNILDIDYEQIKDKLPKQEDSTQNAGNLLDVVIPEEKGGTEA